MSISFSDPKSCRSAIRTISRTRQSSSKRPIDPSAGFANSALRQKYHPYLLAYLTDRGVPESEIIARLGLIDFNGEAHLDIDHCVQTFSNWVMTLQYPDEVPFMHHKTIREFLNIYARYGKSARPKPRKSSFHTSNQDAGFSGTGWQVTNVFRATFRFSIPNCPALFII